MCFAFLVFEIILMICLVLLYYQQLKRVNIEIENEIKTNNQEILKSYNSIIESEMQSYTRDMSLIITHVNMFKNNISDIAKINTESMFAKSNANCFEDNISSEYLQLFSKNKIKDPINTITKEYFDTDLNLSKDIDIMESLSKIAELNKISSLNSVTKDNDICSLQSILKTILIKNVVLGKTNYSLNNIFIFNTNSGFVYPLNNVDIAFLNLFSVFKCANENNFTCFDNKLKEWFGKTSQTQIYQSIDNDLHVWTCANLKDNLTYFICMQNDLNKILNRIKMIDSNYILTTIQVSKDKLIPSLSDKDFNYLDYFKSEYLSDTYSTELQLFHLIYWNIFKNKNASLTCAEIENLEKEYMSITQKIISLAKENTKNCLMNDKNLRSIDCSISQTFLDSNYNHKGEIDEGMI